MGISCVGLHLIAKVTLTEPEMMMYVAAVR